MLPQGIYRHGIKLDPCEDYPGCHEGVGGTCESIDGVAKCPNGGNDAPDGPRVGMHSAELLHLRADSCFVFCFTRTVNIDAILYL